MSRALVGVLLGGGAAAAGLLLWSRRARAATATAERVAGGAPGAPLAETLALLAPPLDIPPPMAPPPGTARIVAPDDANALGRVIVSEVGRGTLAERVAIAWAVRNRARKRGVSVWKMVCSPHCGPQHEANATMRPVSSGQVASTDDLQLAALILSLPDAADPVQGANSFIEPALQDQLASKRVLGYRYGYPEIRAKWLAEKQVPVGTVQRFELWRL